MRIISQDGNLSFPFETIYLGISINNTSQINAYSVNSGTYLKTLATYSTPEKAREIVQTLIPNKSGIYQFPTDEDLK